MNRWRIQFRNLLHFPLLPIWLAALALLSPVFLRGKALFWGTPLLQFGPWWSFAWITILSGHLPLWNPLVGMGAPLFANYQSGLAYPAYWPYLFLTAVGGEELMAWGMAVIAACHLAWAGIGMALLSRKLGWGALSQAVTGLAFGLSGYLVARLGFFSINATSAWLPWILLYLTPSAEGPASRKKDRTCLILCLGMSLLAGHAQTCWYTLVLAGLWAAFWGWNDPQAPSDSKNKLNRMVRSLLGYGLALGLAGAIAAIQLMPTVEYLLLSGRSTAVEYAYALNYSFWPWRFLTLIAPGLFGSPATGDYWGYANYWEDAIYVGLLPFLLASAALVSAFKRSDLSSRSRRLALFLGLITGIAVVFGLGSNTPVYPWLYRHVPSFNMFQAPTRWMIWVEFALALLAGMGADRWRRPEGWVLYWMRLAVMGSFAISVGAGLTWLYLGTVSPSFIRAMAVLGFFGLGAAILALSAPKSERENGHASQSDWVKTGVRPVGILWKLFQPSPPRLEQASSARPFHKHRWQWAVTAFIAVDLLAAGLGLNPGASVELYDPALTANSLTSPLQGGRLYLAGPQEEWLKYSRFLRFDTFNLGEDWASLRRVMLPNTPMLGRIPTTNNFDPLVPGRYADWLKILQDASPQTRLKLLDLMGVRLIESRSRQDSGGVSYQEFNGERLRWVPCGIMANKPSQAREWILREGTDFDQQVILEGEDFRPADACLAPASPRASRFRSTIEEKSSGSNPNRLSFSVTADHPGWLVISDTWYPGWRLWVDGSPAPLYRANYLFRAVHLLEGRHEVVLDYQPVSFYLGAAISLLGTIVLAASWFRKRSALPDPVSEGSWI